MESVARGTPITSPSSSPTGPDTRLYAGLVQAPKGLSRATKEKSQAGKTYYWACKAMSVSHS